MNLGQLRLAVQAKGYGDDTATMQTIFLNEVYREVCGVQRWPFLEAQNSALTTVAGTPGYTLPMANWRNLDAVRLAIPGIQQYDNMRYLDPQELRDYEHVDRDQSTPHSWTFINQQLRLYPTPDSVYTVTIDYIIEATDLSADSDVPLIPLPYHDLLVWGAVESLAFRERDWLGRQFAMGKKEQMLKRMEEEYLLRQRQTASHVKKSGYFDTQLPYPFAQEGF